MRKVPDTQLPMPVRGVDKTRALSDQRADTTQDAENVRSVGADKRVRITQRPGLSKHNETAMAGPVRVCATLVYQNKLVSYEATEDELESNGDGREKHTEVWKKKTETKKDVRNVAVGASGSVYLVSGNTVERRSSSGALEWSLALPVKKKGHICGSLALGLDEAVHVGVEGGEGGAVGAVGAAIFRIRQKVTDTSFEAEPILEWEYRVDGWVRELAMSGAQLKALVQFNEKRRSYVWTFGSISNAVPLLQSEVQVPYPSTCMAVKPDGATITGHPVFADRDSTPGKPGVGLSLESWTLDDLGEDGAHIWARYVASDLASIYEHGDHVVAWEDTRGSGRNWGQGQAIGGKKGVEDTPTLDKKGSLEAPTLRFSGIQGLFSKKGGGLFSDRDSCMSAVPNHGDGAFCIFIVCKPATTSTEGETDENGKALDTRRWLFHQLHHTRSNNVSSAFDEDNTKAHCSGILVNSSSESPETSASNERDLYCWGKSKSLRGAHSPGKARAFTSSSGYRYSGDHDDDGYDAGAWTAGSSSFDFPGMPLLRGAGYAGWPKEGEFADLASSDAGSESWCVMTFLHCGGLNEYESAPDAYSVDTAFIFDSAPEFIDEKPVGSTGTVYATKASDGSAFSDTFTKVSNTIVTLSGSAGTETFSDVKIVWGRNLQTRSAWRINGVPVDRWEALPMGYKGPSTVSSPSPGDIDIDLNVEHNQTGLGNPMSHDYIRGFVGEVADIVVLGNRTDADSAVTLGGKRHYPAPTVISHPKYAENAHTNDSSNPDLAYSGILVGGLSTNMEKIEGMLMNRYGIGKKLQPSTASYPSPHYPELATGTFDIPLADNFADTGQAWIPRLRTGEALLAKFDVTGRMLWCLQAKNVYGAGTGGDLFSEDLNGTGGITGITDAPATSGVALGLDDDVFVVGPGSTASGGSQFCMGKISDKPITADNPQLSSVGWYTQGTPFPPDTNKANFAGDQTVRCKTDEFGNFYVPFIPGTQYDGADALDAIRGYSPDGDLLFRLSTLNHGSSSYQNAYALAFPPTTSTPDYTLDD